MTLKVAIYEGDEPVTNVETVTFDSTSADMNQWKKTVSLTLEERHFDKQEALPVDPARRRDRGGRGSAST